VTWLLEKPRVCVSLNTIEREPCGWAVTQLGSWHERGSVSDQRLVSAATQIYYASFDAVFLKLAPALRARVEAKIDEIGLRLTSFPHHRLKGSNRFRGASETIGSFIQSTWRRIKFIC
jgi:hypothetical protein